eukprot:CAMPEP_0117550336 /NCGR_PEP_ID=MMETSP0784-20121206/48628_1 /TAXON_ID=39447 /ORGANISM="" /LENGTH=309 /DNA_ID=CAMNT_0005347351 /DNA_START=161 /DNA_END=1090 /DNA_ORIENTATION=-
MTEVEIRSHLEPHGIESVRMGNNCAFATFTTWTGAEQAIAALGSTFKVEWCNANGKSKGCGRKPEPKVFIGGISPSCTEQQVSVVGQAFGTPMYVKVHQFKNTPVAFVQYATFAECELFINALNGHPHFLCADGKVLNMMIASPGPAGGRSASPAPMYQQEYMWPQPQGLVIKPPQQGAWALANAMPPQMAQGAPATNGRSAPEIPPFGARVDPRFAHLGKRQIHGTVRSWNNEWGFLVSPSFQNDLFAHKKAFVDQTLESLEPGVPVTFQVGVDCRGRTTAQNVKVARQTIPPAKKGRAVAPPRWGPY